MTTMSDTNDPIDPTIVEKAAKAIDFDQHRYQVNADDWVPRCACGWQGDIPYAVTEHEAHLATLALEAVSPLIAAQALRDEADRLEGMAYGRTGRYTDAGRHIIARIRDRADALEAGAVR